MTAASLPLPSAAAPPAAARWRRRADGVVTSAATGEQLLVAAARGDSAAFAAVYDRVAPQVIGVARRVLRDAALAEEVAQEVLVEVWRKADRFDPARGSAAGWVTTLAAVLGIPEGTAKSRLRDALLRLGEVLEDRV